MRRVILLAMTLSVVAGSWQASMAQATKPAKPKKVTQTKPVETTVAVETAVAPAAVDTTPAVDSTTPDTAHHKKKGLFGKAKSVMGNKIVKAVVKTAACTMVPGGSAIAGAIDAASSKSAGEAAAGAAGVATGTSCMPGMGGMGGAGMAGAGMAGAGMAGAGVAGGAGLAGLAGAGLAAGVGRGMSSGAAGYAPGMAGQGMPMGAYGMGGDPKPMADCMGLTVEEYNAMTNPTGGEARQATKAEMKRMQQLSKKVGSQRQMTCSQTVGMQQASAQMAQMQQMMATAQQQGMPATARPGMPGPNPAAMSEAPGEEVQLATDLAGELKKGKTVVRGIDWMAGSAEVSPAGSPGFDVATATLGQAVKSSGQRYRLDLYMDERYDEATAQTLGPSRLRMVQSALNAALDDPGALQIGKTKRDKNPRLELVKTK